MNDIIIQLKTYLYGCWRHKWAMIGAAWFVCVAGWLYVQVMPDQYQATARVYVDTQSMLRPLLRGLAVETGMQQQLELMTRTLLSRPKLEKVARMTDMDLKAKTPEQMDGLLEALRHNIKIDGTGNVNLYTISYENSDPQLAKRVVQSILTLFVESSLGANREDSNVARSFLSDQVKDYESRLEAAEERLKEFKRKHIGQMPSEGKDYYDRLQEANRDLSSTKEALLEAEKRRDMLKEQVQGDAPAFGVAPQSGSSEMQEADSPLTQRIQNLEMQLDSLLLKYTPQHPDVVAIKRTIDTLKEQRKKELESMPKTPPSDALASNPLYQQMMLQLGSAEADVAALQARYETRKKQVEELKRLVNTIPQVEEDLSQLNRDYNINKENYEKLLSRLESAKLSTQADQNANDVQFKVIDPPRVPNVPSDPNRPLLMSAVLIGGALAGIALALFLSQVRLVFDTRRALSDAAGLPVLGSVSVVWSPAMMLRRRVRSGIFVLSAVLLLGVYSALMTYQLSGANLMPHISGLFGSKT